MTPPLAIVQARLHSSRIPEKMLLPVAGQPLIWWGWNMAQRFFGRDNVVVAVPLADAIQFQDALPDATVIGWPGPEGDVLGRLHAVAHYYRSAPESEIARLTPDDVPVDLTRDWFTLSWLDRMHRDVRGAHEREHVGLLLPPRIEVNSLDDYEEVCRIVTQPND